MRAPAEPGHEADDVGGYPGPSGMDRSLARTVRARASRATSCLLRGSASCPSSCFRVPAEASGAGRAQRAGGGWWFRSGFLRACQDHELGPGLSGGDAEQVLDMLFYRARRQMQPGRDLLVRDARGHQPKHIGLPVGDAQP